MMKTWRFSAPSSNVLQTTLCAYSDAMALGMAGDGKEIGKSALLGPTLVHQIRYLKIFNAK